MKRSSPSYAVIAFQLIGWLAVLLALLFVSISPAHMGAEDPGFALQFDGVNDVVVLHETDSMLGVGWELSKTVSLWVKPTAAPAPCTSPSPAACDNIFGDRARWWGISIGTLSSQDRIWVWNYDGSYDMVPVAYTIDQWVHLSLVHGAGMMTVYRNGILAASIPSGETLQPPAQPVLHLGGIINTVDRNWTFEGLLDEVSLWNYPRSQAEIQLDMRRVLTGTESGLMAYYSMSDGTGTSLSDDGPAEWTGTLLDGAQGVPPNGSPATWVASDAFDVVVYTVFLPAVLDLD